MRCPACGYVNSSEMQFCGQCGTRIRNICPSCHFNNPPTHRFCGMCGSTLWTLPSQGGGHQPPDGGSPTPPDFAETDNPTRGDALLAAQPSEAHPADVSGVAPLAGERRIATSLLADVHHSTDLMEQLGTEAWVELMNQVLQLLAAEVYRFGGRVDQFRGDGLVAFFGAADAHEDDPERAVLAALAMHDAIRAPAETLRLRHNLDLKVRVDVNTGEVIVASVGQSAQHREDTAMGGGVAVAARMETAAEPGTVLVSLWTHHLIESRFEWLPLGEIVVKGISRPIAVFRPLGPRALSAFRPGQDLPLPMAAGRTAALHCLRDCVNALQSGRGGIALLTGEKGMGKSALVGKVRECLALTDQRCNETARPGSNALSEPAVTWLMGQSRSFDQSTLYAVWLGLLRGWLEGSGTQAGPDPSAVLQQQSELLWGAQAQAYAPYLAALLSLPSDDQVAGRIARVDAEELRRRIFVAVRAWVEALAGRGPLVMALGDLQFADASSLELLQHCLSVCDNAPLLWLISLRPDRTSRAWQLRQHIETEYPHRLTSVNLPPLTDDESRALIEQTLGRDALRDAAMSLVIKKGEGNPYYLREIIFALIDQGYLQQDASGAWRQTTSFQSFDLPDSLRALLLARIDRLSAEERRVLQIASVIGTLFWRNVLEAIVGGTTELKLILPRLQRARLIDEQSVVPELGMAYSFTPSLVRDVAYEGLLSGQRAAIHRQVAARLDYLIGPESRKPYHGLLEYHFHQAGDVHRELYHALGAADEARKAYANSDALATYSRILSLLDRLAGQETDADACRAIRELRFEALDGRRLVLIRMGNIAAAESDARELLPLARRLADDPAFMVDALLRQPEVEAPETQAELTAAVTMTQEALALAQQIGDKRREMYSLVAAAQLQALLKNPVWQELGVQAYELSRQLGDVQMQIGLLLGISSTLGMDDLQRSNEYLEAALSIAQHLEDRETESGLLAALGAQCERRGDYHRQLTEYEERRVAILAETGNRIGEGHALMFCGQIEAIYLGDLPSGLAHEQEALARWSELADRLFPMLRIAQIQTAMQQYEAAWATFRSAQTVSERVLLDIGHAGLLLVEAILHNAQGGAEHWRAVLAIHADVRKMVTEDQLSRQYQMAAACEATAAHLGLAGCVEENAARSEHLQLALEASGTALDIYEQFGFTQIVECVGEEILYRRSLALAASERHAEAQELLTRAHEEMMRKYHLIPEGSPYRKSFLENIGLHRQILDAHRTANSATESIKDNQ